MNSGTNARSSTGDPAIARVLPAVEDLSAAAEELSGIGERPTGLVRLNVSRAGYLFVLLPVLPRFQASYPGIELDISIDSALVDIVQLGFDAAFVLGSASIWRSRDRSS